MKKLIKNLSGAIVVFNVLMIVGLGSSNILITALLFLSMLLFGKLLFICAEQEENDV